MKKLIKITTSIIAFLLIILFTVNLLIMRSIKTEIVLNSSKEEVWEVLMNHSSYPNWNPFIKKISGPTQPGDYLQITLQSEGNKPMEFKPQVLINNTNQEFRWLGKLGFKGVFDGEHYFILKQIGPNQIKFIHGENFTGILSGVLMKMIGKGTERGFKAMNIALKALVEKN